MHTYTEPVFGRIYRYSTRRESVVHIENEHGLPLDHGKRLNLSLKIPRAVLGPFLEIPAIPGKDPLWDLAHQIAYTLAELPARKKYYRKALLSLPLRNPMLQVPLLRKKLMDPSWGVDVMDTRKIRINMPRKDVFVLEQWLPNAHESGRSWLDTLRAHLLLFFLDWKCLRFVLDPARGPKRAAQYFSQCLSDAYFSCRILIAHAQEDEREGENFSFVNSRISGIIRELKEADVTAQTYMREYLVNDPGHFQEAIMVCLVYRAFYGAWEKYGVRPFLKPQRILRRYLYGERHYRLVSELMRNLELHILSGHDILKRWNQLYLGNRSAAAKALHLL